MTSQAKVPQFEYYVSEIKTLGYAPAPRHIAGIFRPPPGSRHSKLKIADIMPNYPVISTRFLGQKYRDMRRRHAISPGFSGHYQDLGIASLKLHASACNLIISLVERGLVYIYANVPRHLRQRSTNQRTECPTSKIYGIFDIFGISQHSLGPKDLMSTHS